MTTKTEAKPQPHSLVGEAWDTWLSSVKTMTWSQDQMQVLAGSWMEQAATMRHDGEKVLEVLVTQAKANSEEVQRVAEHAMQAVPGWDALTQADLKRQVETLAAKVDALASR